MAAGCGDSWASSRLSTPVRKKCIFLRKKFVQPVRSVLVRTCTVDFILWNTAGRPAPAALSAFADVADPEMAQAAPWAIEQGYLKARADGSFKPGKGVAKWRVIRGYRAVTEP